ncbi:lamin tail domain-containing protein [Candidatus Woesearchaeota archaeon]|nr:lamin tail domain-containing protein [Candidatus Woesearchaeota archaeon]
MANAPGTPEGPNEWIELYYNGSSTVDLTDWYINDNDDLGDNLTGILSTSNRFIVFSGTQTNINLTNGANIISLYNSSGSLIDSIIYTTAVENESEGRRTDGSSSIVKFSIPTPGNKNDRDSPDFNGVLYPDSTPIYVNGIINIRVNVTDAIYSVNSVVVDFNGTDYRMSQSGDTWSYAWNTNNNPEGVYSLAFNYNDTIGNSGGAAWTGMLYVDRTSPAIYNPVSGANPRDYIAAGSTIYPQVRSTDSNPIKNVTCTMGADIEEAAFLGGDIYVCTMNASLSQWDYTVVFNSEDIAGNINTTAVSFTTKNLTSGDVSAGDITVSGLNQTDKENVLVSATLTNTGNSPMYDPAITIESIEASAAIPDAYTKACNETQLNASQSCNIIFNLTVAGGTPPKDYVIFWTADWTDNMFIPHNITPFSRSYIDIRPNPIIGVPVNWTFSMDHGTNQTKQLQIDSMGNGNLSNIGFFYFPGNLPANWVVIESDLTNIPPGLSGLFNVTVMIPEFTYPGTYTGTLTISATDAVPKNVELIVEVLEDNSWTVTPQHIDVFVAKEATGLVGTYFINNTGNIDQIYNITYTGDFFNKILDWPTKTPPTLNVPKNTVGTLPIYIIDTRDQSNYTLSIDLEGNNSVHQTATMKLYVGDNAPLVSSWYWETPAANSTTATTIPAQENSSVYFEADIKDPDGEEINATWVLDMIDMEMDTVSSNGTINWTYNPDLLSAGTHTVKLKIITGNKNSDSINWTVIVADNNQQPQIALQIPDQQLAEDTNITVVNLSQYFSDPDPDNNLTYSVTQQNATEVSCVINGDNLTIIPVLNWFGVGADAANCSVAANDGAINSLDNSFSINITPVPDDPIIIIDDVLYAQENQEFAYDINATDPDGDNISAFWSDSSMFEIESATGVFNFTPGLGDVGDHIITFSVNDTTGAVADKIVTLSVHFQNHAPVLNPIGDKSVDEDSGLQFSISAQDIDISLGDSLTFSCNLSDIGVNQLGPTSAEISWIPTDSYVGDNDVEFTVTDDNGSSDSEIINIQVIDVNDAPVIESYYPAFDDPKIPEDGSQVFTITKSDRDNDPVTANWYVDGVLQVSGDSFTFNADGTPGTNVHDVTAVISDGIVNVSRSWVLTTSDVPVTSRYSGTITYLTPEQLETASHVVIENAFGRIDFGDAVIDLSDVVDLDRYVNIDSGIIGIDTNKLHTLREPAEIKMYSLAQTDMPIIYYSSGFELSGGEVCPATKCTNRNYDGSTLTFDIDHFTIFWVISTSTNYPPEIVSSPVTASKVNEYYSYDVDAIDPDNDVLTYSLTTSQPGMTINPSSGLINWLPSATGDYSVAVSVSDGVAGTIQNFTLHITETGIAPGQSMLAITDLDVKVGGESDKNLNDGDKIDEDAKPGSELEFSIKVENMFTDNTEIDDVRVTVEILDIDDGDDIEEDSKDFSLDDGEDEKVTLSLSVPLLVEENTYDVVITVEGEDDYGNDQEIEWRLLLDVDKEKHDLIIHSADIVPSTIRCNRYATLDLEVVNIGNKDEEDVVLKIENNELGISIKESDIELEHGADEDDCVYERSMHLTIPDDVSPRTYPVSVKVYRGSKLMDSATSNIVITECSQVKKTSEPVDVQTVTTTSLPPVYTYQPLTMETRPAKVSFRETDEYLMLLAIGTIIMLGLVIYGIGATIILYKKK